MSTIPPETKQRPAPLELPTLGREGEVCPNCGAQLASDQRYCLACGRRRAATRVPFAALGDAGAGAGRPPAAGRQRDWTPIVALAGLATLAIVLVVGVLIGKSTGSSSKQVAAAPQVIRVGGGGTAASTGSSFKSDWPSGKTGFTVELGSLSKDGTSAAQVEAAKKDAQGRGAPAVGALDSDDFGSLPGGSYLVYSGIYSTKAEATKALAKLHAKFPKARVVKVSGGSSGGGGGGGGKSVGTQQLNNLNNLSGQAYEKQSRKLPNTTKLPGKPPPTDNKAPGGGGSAQEIK